MSNIDKLQRNHAEVWRDSIDVEHKSPDGKDTTAKYFDGIPFNPIENIEEIELKKIESFLKKHLL
jgi:hypothetical protein